MLNLSEIPANKQEKAKYWLKVFEDWKKSQLSKSKYCKLNKIGDSNFYHWFKYLQINSNVSYSPKEKAQTKNNPLNFMSVNVVQEQLKIAECDTVHTGLSIIFSKGLSLRLEKDFDPVTLLKVVKVLEVLC